MKIDGKWRLHLATCLVAFLAMAVVPLFVQCFHAELIRSREEEAILAMTHLSWVRARTGLGLLPQLWLAASLVSLLLLGALAAFEAIVRRLRLDPRDDAWTSLAWAMRSWKGWLFWLALILLGVAVGAPAVWLPDFWELLVFLPPIVAVCSLPFIATNAANLLPANPPGIWMIRWPGAFAVMLVICTRGLEWALDRWIDGFGLPIAIETGISLLLWIPGVVVTLFGMIAWLNRARAKSWIAHLRMAMRPPLVLATLVQQGRYFGLGCALALALLPMTALLVFVVPQVENLVGRHVGLGWGWNAWIAFARLYTEFWWILVLLPAWFAVVAFGRLLVQQGVVDTPPESAPA